jgi:hypothetical protein
MRLLFNVASALAAFVAARLWWRASQPPPRPEVRWQHRPRLRGVGAFLGTSQSAGRAIHWSSCPQASSRRECGSGGMPEKRPATFRRAPKTHMCCSFSSSYVRAHSLHSTFESPICNG